MLKTSTKPRISTSQILDPHARHSGAAASQGQLSRVITPQLELSLNCSGMDMFSVVIAAHGASRALAAQAAGASRKWQSFVGVEIALAGAGVRGRRRAASGSRTPRRKWWYV